ncbi:hypothetical protein [Alloalcanivorax marinus]|uniref:hypothetical protein n=1 Tax=Alloalcanivorax marinus TaxID=1177169 RepID=UPI0019315395|nr:hypothetical protein [Alloalcanivorax marinus]MBL7250823.1 hypothetical protein [Alloalcanivorax marinus]
MNRFVLLCLLGWVAGLGLLAQTGAAAVTGTLAHQAHHAPAATGAMMAPRADTPSRAPSHASGCEQHTGACPCPPACQSASLPWSASPHGTERTGPGTASPLPDNPLAGFSSPPWRPPSLPS